MVIPVLEFPNISLRFPFRFSEEFSVFFRCELRGEKGHRNSERIKIPGITMDRKVGFHQRMKWHLKRRQQHPASTQIYSHFQLHNSNFYFGGFVLKADAFISKGRSGFLDC
ncbi:hypothetical protein CEXT_207011 [Caerostris extrusa]|uniref:Uncharacterized protein n=1 Tax=Caerostris extrusa TaxID=172846 RepID=A0AAV4Q335_CAEEX|nr:hypothetical protein CEXT_207011 [Caerostris extrusa]